MIQYLRALTSDLSSENKIETNTAYIIYVNQLILIPSLYFFSNDLYKNGFTIDK